MVKRVVMVSAGALFLALGLSVVSAGAQTVDEVVAKNYASKGGPEKWKAIQTQKMTGVASTQGMELGMVVYGKRPNLGRQDLTVDIPGQGVMTMVNIFDGTKAWMINPMMGPEPQEISGPEGDMVKDQSDFDGALLDYKAKGHTVELVGPATVGTRQAHHLKVTRKGQPVQHYYIDTETGVELKITTEAAGGPAVDTEMSDYRVVDGIQVPHLIRVMQGGAVQAELRITKVEFNIPLEDSLFKGR